MTELWTDNGYYNIEAVKDGSIWEGEMTYTKWSEKYKPVQNHLTKYKQIQFETYGEEQEYVFAQDHKYVWTWVDGDCSSLLIAGTHYVNRLAYYICEEPWETGDEQVLLSVEVECQCYDDEKYEYGGDPECKLCEGEGYRTEYLD